MARDWEFMRDYERNNLADLPPALRTLLLSNIAVYGPEDGIGSEGLNNLLMLPVEDGAERDAGHNNDGFYRLDLSGSVGRSISFKQLIEVRSADMASTYSWQSHDPEVKGPRASERIIQVE